VNFNASEVIPSAAVAAIFTRCSALPQVPRVNQSRFLHERHSAP
jgi:hypothetical protein